MQENIHRIEKNESDVTNEIAPTISERILPQNSFFDNRQQKNRITQLQHIANHNSATKHAPFQKNYNVLSISASSLSTIQQQINPFQSGNEKNHSVIGNTTQLVDYFVERFGTDIMNTPIGLLRNVIDDTSVNEEHRIRAEAILIEHEPLLARYRQIQVQQALALIRAGNFDVALRFIVGMMGINLNGGVISSVAKWTDVVAADQVPRGGGLGLTLPGATAHDPPRIYIKRSVMQRWASTMEFGNLAATIAHEAIHAGQNARGEAADDSDYREFEAYANEICDTHYRILNSDKEFFPSGSHMLAAHRAATGHWDGINFDTLAAPLRDKSRALKEKMDNSWNVVRGFTNRNDAENGLSDSKVTGFRVVKDRLKVVYDEARELELPDDRERLTVLKGIASDLGVQTGRLRGDMNENELNLIDPMEEELDTYTSYFNRNMKFMGL